VAVHSTATHLADELADHVGHLARRIEALEDFAGLVAHDVKSALIWALRDEDPRDGVMRALELVESILEAVRADAADARTAQLAECVRQAIADLGGAHPEIVAGATGEFPLAPEALRLVLRNLLANAIAAGAQRIHVSAVARGDRQLLVVDDDGAGHASPGGYATGAQLGLGLCRRVLERCGCVLELRPRSTGGTRAVIVVTGSRT